MSYVFFTLLLLSVFMLVNIDKISRDDRFFYSIMLAFCIVLLVHIGIGLAA